MISFFPDSTTFLEIGSLSIKWYAVLILTGSALAYFVSKNDFKKCKYTDLDFFDSLIFYTLWVGIIGARVWYVIFSPYKMDPADYIKIWNGGLAIQGGIVFGALFVFFYCKKNHYSFLKILDIVLPNVLIGQAFGRWGNFINRECYGGIVEESYFDGILSFLKKGMYIGGEYHEPLFFYESMLCILGWVLIHFVLKKHQNKRGDLGYSYLMWYGVIRFFIEAKRTDSLVLGNYKMAQITSIIFIIVGLLGYLGIFRKLIKGGKPTLIFDFDGTIIDTSESIIEAYRECFKKYSDEKLFTKKIQNEVLGPALRDLFPKYFPGYDYDTIYETYRTKQNEISPRTNKPTTNSFETLKKLHERGYHIGILSTRKKEGIEEMLKNFEMDKYIDDICGLNDVENLKPNPEGIIKMIQRNKWNKDCVVIGDSIMDIKCGQNYGAYTVAYLDNPSRLNEMKEMADESITDFADLEKILQKDINFTSNKL